MMGGRVLAVDDSALVLRLLSMTLGKAGYDVSTASSGEEAVRLIRELRPGVVFLDAVLPGISGFEVARIVRDDPDIHPKPYVVLLTGLYTATPQGPLPPGIDAIISKPFQPAHILDVVRKVMGD